MRGAALTTEPEDVPGLGRQVVPRRAHAPGIPAAGRLRRWLRVSLAPPSSVESVASVANPQPAAPDAVRRPAANLRAAAAAEWRRGRRGSRCRMLW